MILGLIPARGGSKRLPRKNIKLLHGRPLIAWTIIEAQKSPYLDKVVVTTDDEEIADLCRDYRCEVIRRPHHLGHDKSLVYLTISHAMDAVGGCDAVCLLQPTSPLRTQYDIDECCKAFEAEGKEVVSVTLGESVPNGAVYVGRSSWLKSGGNWDDGTARWYAMPSERGVDINTIEDFRDAEKLMSWRGAA